MSDEKLCQVIRGIVGFCFFLGFSYLLNPEFVGQYCFLVIAFFISLVGGLMYYRHLQRSLEKKIALEEEKLKLRQEKLQQDFAETMKELLVMQTEIQEYHQKTDEMAKKDLE
ncbi:hypothetical protein [Enterococcus sp. AZ109]|uniref:hypothetical protein n=1 Tax=Enterococcus sp. AZ109 TaxID=2774634 RepID=UPI003F21C35E